jgi:hypothetical protein
MGTQTFPFQPDGGASSTTNGAVTASSAQITLPAIGSDGGSLLLTNIGTQTVFIAYGNVTASVTTSMPLLAASAQTISVPGGVTQLSVIAAATGSTLYCTAGRGV